MNKLKSTKLWITIWSILLISYIVIQNRTEFYGIQQLLCQVPMSYIVQNVQQKAIYKKTDINLNNKEVSEQ